MNVEDVEDVGGVVDEVTLVADVDVDYEDVGSDSVAEPERVVSYTAIQIDSALVSLGKSLQDFDHVTPSWAVFPCIFSYSVQSLKILHRNLWTVRWRDSRRISLLQSQSHRCFALHLLYLDRLSTMSSFQRKADDVGQFDSVVYYCQADDKAHFRWSPHWGT